MVHAAAKPALARAHRKPRRLQGTRALVLLASVIVALLAGSAAPTPLYAIYQAHWGFSSITTTIIFGIYAVSVLVALLTLGKLSDHVGRKPILLVTLFVQVAVMIVFANAGDVSVLLVGRVIQGIATGAALGAIGAGMLDIDPKRGQLSNAVAPGIGTGSGALLSALLITYLPAPTQLVYYVLAAVFLVQALGVSFMRETVRRVPGALASLKPEIKLPRTVRAHFLAAAPVLFATWALAGLYGALGPALVAKLAGSASTVLGGLILVAFAGVASALVIALRNTAPIKVMTAGIVALLAGVAVTLLALGTGSLPLFFFGTAIAGLGFGGGFQGGIRIVVPLVQPHERSGVLSLLYVISYLGFGGPAVVAGVLTVHGPGLLGAAAIYGVAVIVLALLALAALIRAQRKN
jgi:predicted MFS family arabinose efflux permease